jgi:exodeoxyribonuclease V gamma subunit
MALTIYRSNRVETLQSRLVGALAEAPLTNPFAAETIVVPTHAMARWLNLSIARQQGIAANLRYPQPGEWLWGLAASLLDEVPQHDPYARDALGWSIFDALPGSLDQTAFIPLRKYLEDDTNGIKRWQLSQRIADCFDRYQSFRPAMIAAWSKGDDSHWQALLWRRVVAASHLPHRVELMQRLRQRLAGDEQAGTLPQRVCLFALSHIEPAFFEVIHRLSAHSEVLLFQHNPTDQYWADLVSEKTQARKRLQDPRQGDYYDSGNHLLTSWGRQGQTLQDLLLDLGSVTGVDIEDNQPPISASLLKRLQASLFHLEQPRLQPDIDDSISVQLCHSPLRECQVLHDHLLSLLDRHDDLTSEDILVMVPEISRYAPYIEAVFQHDPSHKRPNLSWNISDITIADGHPLVRVFLQLLKLPACRFTHSEILSFLECGEIRKAFGLDPSMLDDINRLLDSARVRWGIDAGQRRELGLPAIHENTWEQAWERIFAGYAMPSDTPWQGTAPISDIDADSGIAIARFRYLFERLVYWRQELGNAAGTTTWQQRLHRLVDEFLAPDDGLDDLSQPLRHAIGELGQTRSRDLGHALISYWMEKQLATSQQPGRLYSGGVTFCGMQPMRNIPFAVICVLGMQDNAFPRRERVAEFDLMRDNWRAGDPHRGDEDRYLMLETLLCARRYLYFSYCGRSLKDNSECQPSVLLRELLDYLDSCAGEQVPISARITHLHPMQPFSAKNFCGASPGYDRHWYDTACLLARVDTPPAVTRWRHQALAPTGEPEASTHLDTLVRFFQHPLRFFYNQRLGIRIPRHSVIEDEEAFVLQGLQKWSIVEQLAHHYLAGEPIDRKLYSARGLLPHGRAADTEWFALLSEYHDLLDRLEAYRETSPEVKLIDCQLGDGSRLYGEVNGCYRDLGLMHYSASKAIKSRTLMSLWLNHLALCASGQLPQQESSQLFAPSTRGWRFNWLDAESASEMLGDYLALFRQGQQYPLPVFPETSFTWASQWASHSDPELASSKAFAVWSGGGFNPTASGESADAFIQLALHNNTAEPLRDELFQHFARQIYGPAIVHGETLD